jgi:hypothetical protein
MNQINHIYDYFSDAIIKHPELFKGLRETISSPQFDKVLGYQIDDFMEMYNEDKEWYDDMYSSTDVYVESMMYNYCSNSVLDMWGDQFIKNLLDVGFTYNSDDESWTLPDEKYMDPIFKDMNVTNYGLIWLVWYDLDTDVRESLGDYFERIVENYFNN